MTTTLPLPATTFPTTTFLAATFEPAFTAPAPPPNHHTPPPRQTPPASPVSGPSPARKPAPPPEAATAKPPPASQRRPAPPKKAAPPGHDLGRLGEELAAEYLESLGLVLLCRNWRCREGELDIIATDGHRLVVAEVKTRSSDDFGTPADAMTPAKIRKIKAATNAWLRNFSVPWCEISYDLVAIWWPATGTPQLQHRRGAF
jgi:putative endonuclease